MKRDIDVYIGETAKRLGTLYYNRDGNRERSAFEYHPDWLADSEAFPLEPSLRLIKGPQFYKTAKDGSKFSGAIADTEPDGWGRRVILRDHAKRREQLRADGGGDLPPPNALDFLLAVDDMSRIGAIRLREDNRWQRTAPEKGQRTTPPVLELPMLLEYQSQVLFNMEPIERFYAPFPEQVKAPVQYGSSIRSQATYMSQWQLIPYERICEYFSDQTGIPISAGTVFNCNFEAYERLGEFEQIAKQKLIHSSTMHADETGINIDGKNYWLHSASNEELTLFCPHEKRGNEATDEIGVLPNFKGNLIHDCWGPYFKYTCTHALCNAHILRELTAIWENDGHKWAKKMEDFLRETNNLAHQAGGVLSPDEFTKIQARYDRVLKKAGKESPPPDPPTEKKRGRTKKTKARNLLERLVEHKDAVLRFAENIDVPFTNNQAEGDIRMTKVQQKISGCFRSLEGAKIFCRIRSYLSTCHKNGVSSTTALNLLFQGKLPDFIKN